MSRWKKPLGAAGRWKREVRRRLVEPVLMQRRFLEIILNALTARGHLIYCRQADTVFFVDPSDRVVGDTLMWRGDWQRGELENAVKFLEEEGRLKAGSVFVDAGANIGTQTVYALKTGRFAHAVAFEPEPNNARLLAMNVEANGFSGRVRIVNKALGAEAGTAVLYLHPNNKAAHALDNPPSDYGYKEIKVPVTRLDAALSEASVPFESLGLIWIDVEGHEPQLARGLGRILEHSVPLVIEFAPHRYDPDEQRAFVELLGRHYGAVRRLDGAHKPQPVSSLAEIRGGLVDILVY